MQEKARILIAEDNRIMRETLRMLLQKTYDVEAVDSGEACLEVLARSAKDLVLLDINMTGIDGYETCRRLRQDFHHLPVIFVSALDSLEERLLAFDSGSNDFVLKPFSAEVLLRKVAKAIELYAERSSMLAEKASLEEMAKGYLQNAGEASVLLNFMRSTIGCIEYPALAKSILQAGAEYGLNCHVQIRHEHESLSLTRNGLANGLEVSILEKSATMGRMFQFSKRLVLNFDFVTLLVNDLPDDPVLCARIRDNVTTLAETAEAVAEAIGLRKQAAEQAAKRQQALVQTTAAIERLREMHHLQQLDTRFQLQHLLDRVEKSYSFLAMSVHQEETLSSIVRGGTDQVLGVFERNAVFEQEFETILAALAE